MHNFPPSDDHVWTVYLCSVGPFFPEIFALVPGQLLADNAPKNPPQT